MRRDRGGVSLDSAAVRRSASAPIPLLLPPPRVARRFAGHCVASNQMPETASFGTVCSDQPLAASHDSSRGSRERSRAARRAFSHANRSRTTPRLAWSREIGVVSPGAQHVLPLDEPQASGATLARRLLLAPSGSVSRDQARPAAGEARPRCFASGSVLVRIRAKRALGFVSENEGFRALDTPDLGGSSGGARLAG
jgi:hypothetical protein